MSLPACSVYRKYISLTHLFDVVRNIDLQLRELHELNYSALRADGEKERRWTNVVNSITSGMLWLSLGGILGFMQEFKEIPNVRNTQFVCIVEKFIHHTQVSQLIVYRHAKCVTVKSNRICCGVTDDSP